MGYVLLSIGNLIHTNFSKGEFILPTKSKGRSWVQVFRQHPQALCTLSSTISHWPQSQVGRPHVTPAASQLVSYQFSY